MREKMKRVETTRIVSVYTQAIGWVGVIVAALVDFFNRDGSLGRSIDFAADMGWALMNLLIATYGMRSYARAATWGARTGLFLSLGAIVLLCVEWYSHWLLIVGWGASLLNGAISCVHLLLQVVLLRTAPRSTPSVLPTAQDKELEKEKKEALTAGSQRQYEVALNMLGRATAARTQTEGSHAHVEAAEELLKVAGEGHHVEAQYQLLLLYAGRYGNQWRNPVKGKQAKKDLKTFFSSTVYNRASEVQRQGWETIRQAIEKE